MLAKDPRHRFQTAAEVANAMVPFAVGDDLLRGLPRDHWDWFIFAVTIQG